MHKCIVTFLIIKPYKLYTCLLTYLSAAYAVVYGVCPVSVTFVYSVETAKYTAIVASKQASLLLWNANSKPY